ncbi:paraoxonase [Aspergillus bombycis]|uniref:Paraoxonase n=1 Tax=Aspergillus bombycis TaxID=109264 RepID=A0A1F7ZV19_9EURO|nr:paraoxonase [Aspergillus bombycis]OGM43314.1 paraoxonase [Aspergillus bombycis]
MAGSARAFVVLILAITIGLYKVYLHDAVVLVLGIGRVIQPLEDFPGYRCQRIQHPLLESCEDLWLDSTNRKLYAACSNPAARKAWSPGGNTYDLSGLAAAGGSDHISVLDIDRPGPDGLYGVHALGFREGGNNQRLHLHGFDVRRIDHGRRLRFWLINHRPPMDTATGETLLDATHVGANSTIDVYDLDLGNARKANHLAHVKTIVSDAIISPNNLVVIDGDKGDFLVTNDHSTKVGALRDLGLIFGDGSIAYCRTDTGKCHIATTENCYMPNGITRDPSSGRIYVAHSAKGTLGVNRLTDDNRLVQIDEVPLTMSVDNLSIDAEGNVFAGGFPDAAKFWKAWDDPYGTMAPSTVLMIWKKRDGHAPGDTYEVVKVVEDGEARVLPTTTTAVHDPISGRLFLGGVTSPFIGVCDRVG